MEQIYKRETQKTKHNAVGGAHTVLTGMIDECLPGLPGAERIWK